MRSSPLGSCVCLALLLASTLVACDGPSPDEAANGGDLDAGERDGSFVADATSPLDDAGGDGDTALEPDGSVDAPANLSNRMACLANVKAQCDRRERCVYARHVGCETADQLCPDSAFSPGSTRDAASLFACAKQWENFDCTDLAAGKVPACVAPGTREVGEACIFPNQCKTLACSGGPATCGQCIERAALGAACSATAPCVMGAVCTEGTCNVPEPVVPNGAQLLGSPCGLGGCVPGARCLPDPGSPTKFRCALVALGDQCAYDDCPLDTAYCSTDHFCVALPRLGEECAHPGGTVSLDCEPGTRCESTKCVARLPLGAKCTSRDCLEDLECEERTPQGYGTCLAFHEEGESCSGQFERCVRNTECVDGICRAIASRGLFESACGGT